MKEKYPMEVFAEIRRLISDGDLDASLDLALTANQEYPDEPEGYFLCAEIYRRLGVVDSAVSFLKEACSLEPRSIPYRGRLAEQLLSAGDLDAAINNYRIVLDEQRLSWAFIGLGNALERKGDHLGAMESFEQALQVLCSTPGSPPLELLYRLLNLQETYSDFPGQLKTLETIVNVESDGPKKYEALCKVGRLHALCQRHAEAVSAYSTAIDAIADREDAYIGLANIYQQAGEPQNERSIILRALQLIDRGYFRQRLENLTHLSPRKCIRRPKVIAYYLPQFHVIPENSKWWGDGFTEWNNVTTGKPAFGGHLQPRRPSALGYYDLRVPETVNRQFALARQYEIDAFCYYFYWFNGHRLLDRPLRDLMDGRTGPFPFCICWVNEEWTRSWDGMSGEVLMPLDHKPENDRAFIEDCLPILKHPHYLRADNKPMLLVYRADKLSHPRETAQFWRDYCQANGLDGIYLCAVQSFGFDDPAAIGFDAAVEFPPHAVRDKHPGLDFHRELDPLPQMHSQFTGKVYNYQHFAECAIKRPKEPYPLHRACMLAWDNTARRGSSAHIYHYFSVSTYERWLTANVSKALQELSEPFVFVNAWNEWAEGSNLEPDEFFGYELLEATRRAKTSGLYASFETYWSHGLPSFPANRRAATERILLVGHNACFNGAQINLMHMARCLRRTLGLDVIIILLEGGDLVSEYEKIGSVVVLGTHDGWQNTALGCINHYAAMGITKAICNTVVTGEIVQMLKDAGFKVCSLVHELPALIAEYQLESRCELVAAQADNLVFASRYVKDAFCEHYRVPDEKILLAPQGISFNPYHNRREELRRSVREELNIAPAAKVVMSCGYGDMRKGVDLFVRIAAIVCDSLPAEDVAFVWVGELHGPIASYIDNDIKRLNLRQQFFVTGRVDDTARFYLASEVFALTSREDPFPSVVMEAFDGKLPVVAFEGGGGYVDIVGEESGALAPYLDVVTFAEAVTALLVDDERRERIGERNLRFSRNHFGYEPYMRKLLDLLGGKTPASLVRDPERPRPRISVILPNYNYERYLELRLRTILDQTLPPDEVIILDDASTDESLPLIQVIVEAAAIPCKIVRNERNSGNVFHQWELGIKASTGDLIWIAEADDYCEPRLLEKLVSAFDDEEVVMSYTDSIMVDDQGKSSGFAYKSYYGERQPELWHSSFCIDGRDLLRRCLLIENVVPNASAVVFRRCAVPNDLPDIKNYWFSGDWWFWIGVAERGKVAYLAEPLNYHRRHSSSVMGGVLSQGEKLLPETMSFYRRLVEQKEYLMHDETIAQMKNWLDILYGYFPELAKEAITLENHPILGKILHQLLPHATR